MSTTTLREILGNRRLYSTTPDTTIAEVARIMASHQVGAVAVVSGDDLVGIITERDIVFRAVAHDLPVETSTVALVMTPDPATVSIDDAISDALATKLGDAFRHLPVMENGHVTGLLSYRDIPPEYVMMFERFREMSTARADSDV